MSALLQSLAAGFSGDNERRALLDAALRDGLPGPRSEAWKYTPLRALERRSFQPAAVPGPLDPQLIATIPSPRMVFVNGHFDTTLSDLHGLPAGVQLLRLRDRNPAPLHFQRSDEVFARLNTALADDGMLLQVDDGVRAMEPIHLVFIGVAADADSAWHLHHRIEIGAGARATLVEHRLHASEHAHLGNELIAIAVASEGELRHLRNQNEAARATSLLRTEAALAADAVYRRLDVELGAGLSRHVLNVRLHGERARLIANGVLLADGRRHVDTRLGIEHVALNTSSELLWRGIAAARSKVVFHGGITIHAGADGTDANLSNKNLLLSDDAEIDSQPVLEIHADEVKAAHGATVGQLDPTAMFYLRSRGLPFEQARQLLIAAFCREPAGIVENPQIRELLTDSIDTALRRLEAS